MDIAEMSAVRGTLLVDDAIEINDVCSKLHEVWQQIDRGSALLQLAYQYKDEELPLSVEEFLTDTKELFSMEGLNVSIGSFKGVGNVIDAIKRAIQFMADLAIDLFRRIFDQYYRAQRKFLNYQSTLLQITDDDRKEAIVNTVVNVAANSAVNDLIKEVLAMNLEMQSASGVATADHLDRFIRTATKEFGCKYTDGKLLDVRTISIPTQNITLLTNGWSFDAIKETLKGLLVLSNDIVTTKQTEKNINKMIKELESDLNRNVRTNSPPAVIQNIQDKLADKRRIQTFINSGLVILATRLAWLDTQITLVMNAVQKAR